MVALARVNIVTRKPLSTLIRRRHLVVSDDHRGSIPASVGCVDRIANSGDFGKLTMISDTCPDLVTNLEYRRLVDDSLGLIPARALQVLLSAIVAPALSTIEIIVFHSRQYSMEVKSW